MILDGYKYMRDDYKETQDDYKHGGHVCCSLGSSCPHVWGPGVSVHVPEQTFMSPTDS